MNTSYEDEVVQCNSAYNPFPEPQTIPSGWDLTGILSTPQTDDDVIEEDSTEN